MAQDKVVDIPGVGAVAFPGDMPDEAINQTIERDILKLAPQQENEFERAGRAGLGGLEAGLSMASKIPGFIGGGLMGAGNLLAGRGMDKASEAMEHFQNLPVIKGYDPQSEYGKLALEGLEDARTATGKLGGDSPALRTGNEVAFDLLTMMLPMGPKVGRGAPAPHRMWREPTMQERALAEAQMSIENRRLQDAAAKAERDAVMGDQPVGEPQGQLFQEMPQQTPLYEQPGTMGPTPTDMMGRMGERMADEQAARAPDQADLFDPSTRETFPGIQRSEDLQRQQLQDRGHPYGLSTSDPNQLSGQPREPFRMDGLDWETRLERLENDPYFGTLHQEFKKHIDDYNRNMHNVERADAYGQTPRYAQSTKEMRDRYDRNARKALDKANESLSHANEAWMEADRYYKQRLTDLQIGKITAKEDLQMGRIEKTTRPPLGPKKQQGGVRMDFLTGEWTVEKLSKWLEEAGKRVVNLEALKNRAESAEKQAKIDDRLEELYRDMQKANNEILRLSDPTHPLHNMNKKTGMTRAEQGKWLLDQMEKARAAKKKPYMEGGSVYKDIVEAARKRREAKVNPQGFEVGGLDSLPEDLKRWVYELAELTARDKLEANGVRPEEMRRGDVEVVREFNEYFNEALDNPDFVKQAIANSGGFNTGRMQPVVPLGSKGKYGRQRGTIDFSNDPDFLKFKDELPEPMKPYAKGAWKEMQRMKAVKVKSHYGNQPVIKEQAATEVMNKVPGLKTWKDRLLPILEDPKVVKERALTEQDVSGDKVAEVGRQMVSGAKIYGLGTGNTLIRYVAQGIDRVIRESQQFIDRTILNKTTGFKPMWEKLSEAEQGQLWQGLRSREGLASLTRGDFFDMGFSEKMVNAAEALRKALDATYELLNKARAAKKLPPIDYTLNYIPSRFRGDFVVHVRDGDGKLVHMMGANSLPEAKRLKRWLEQRPEGRGLTIEDPLHEPLHRFRDASDATTGYQMMIDALSKESPLVDGLEKAYEAYLEKQAYDAFGTKHHFKDKTGVRGSEGDKMWLDAYENAQEGLRSIMNYIDHASKWAFNQIEMQGARQLLKDKDIMDKQPNAAAYSQAYSDLALGRSPKMARALDSLVDKLAEHSEVGQSMMLKGIRDTKYFITTLYLGFMNTGFSLSQIVQTVQTQPSLMRAFKEMGAESSLLNAYARGMMDATKGTFMGRDKMSPLGQQAWNYAKERGIVEPKILDDARSWKDKSINQILDIISSWSMEFPEKVARTQAYMAWVHFLDQAGVAKGKELFEAAGQMTDITMVDYRMHERPMLYKQAGIIGEAANALTTFKHNYYSQMWLQRQLAKEHKSVTPELMFYTTLFMLGGGLSLPMREDLDMLISAYNWAAGKTGAGRMPTSRELMLMAPDMVSFGPTSALSGLDVTSKFSAANAIPDDPVTAAFPFAGSIADFASAAGGMLADPSMTNAMRLSKAVSPSSSQFLHEDYFRKDDVLLDSNSLEGVVRRGPKEDKARAYTALRSLDESKERHAVRTAKDEDSYYASRRQSILKKAKDRAFEGNFDAVSNLAQDFVKAEGKPSEYVSEIINNTKEQHRTRMERMLAESMNNPQRLQRRMGKR